MPAATFNLPYRDAFGSGSRPYLALHVTGPSGANGTIIGLIDSGADSTSLPAGYASLMGYTGADLVPSEAGHAGGGSVNVLVAQVPAPAFVIGWPEVQFDLFPTFVPGGSMSLWGRNDFFRVFEVTVREAAQTFSLTV